MNIPAFRSAVLLCVLSATWAGCPPPSAAASASSRPNIVFFLADDLGYMDIGANNPRTFYETPNIDALARRGVRFTRGYAACPVCSPTRASIMTGKFPPRTGITDYIPGMRNARLRSATNATFLAASEITLAESLQEAGYRTFFAGKWHLGSRPHGPDTQGFEGPLSGQGQFYYPESGLPVPDNKTDPKTTDRIANEAVRFIKEHRDEPFFAYLPFLAVHIPVGARPDLVAKYQQKQALAPPDAWGKERASKVRLIQNRADYAAMLEQMDQAVGHVLDTIETEGLTRRTIVVFTSDNGGLATAEGHPTANLPLRAGKGWLYEGGIRVAYIISAPGVARRGTVCDTPVLSTDFYPTLLELARLPLRPEQHRDGVSLVPLLKGRRLERGPLFWHYPHYGNQGGAPSGAVMDGRWKLIEWYEDNRCELFDLRKDEREQMDLARDEPGRVRDLHARLEAFRRNVGALMPTPNPDWREPE